MNKELDEEIQFHLDARTRDNLEAGMGPDAARQDAVRRFGNRTAAMELAREADTLALIESIGRDFGYAFRSLRKAPGFTAVAVVTLALGVGANTAIFSAVYATLIRPLPYTNPGELVAMSVDIPQLRSQFPNGLPVRAVDFQEFQRSNRVFPEMAAIRERDFNLTGRGEPERLYGARVTANLFSLLGVEPQLGRTFRDEEDTPGRDTVVQISHGMWVSRFGADPNIVNRTLSLDGNPHVIVGVMPAGFLFPAGKQLHPQVELGPRIDVWKPMAFTPSELAPEDIGRFSWGVIARLKPGMTLQAAQSELNTTAREIGRQMQARIPGLAEVDLRTQLVPIRDVFAGNLHEGLLMLMGAAGLLLIIACVNLANLLLARMTSRSRELATRAALGAARGRLVRQVLSESVLLAMLGGAAGLLIAVWGTRTLLSLGSADFTLPQSVEFNVPVFLFATGIVLAVGLVIGVVPAVNMTRENLHGQLTESTRGMSTGRETGQVRRALVTAEVALCTALLLVGGLLLRSFVNVMGADKGFAVERVLSVDLALSTEQYGGSQSLAFYRELLESIRALPGVLSAGAISILPLTSASEGNSTGIYLEEDREQRLDRPVAHYRVVTQGYFPAMGIPLLAGRLLETEEPASAVLVSEELVRRLWPDTPPSKVVGRGVRIGEVTDDPATIVGVVGDVRAAALDREPTPAIYVPHARNRAREMAVVIRTTQEPETLIAAVRSAVWNRDAAIPVPTARTMSEIVSASVAPRRFQMAMILLFAAIALGLALVGVFGITSYAVTRQTREIGIRIAVGAERSVLLRSVLKQGLRPVVLGLLLGLPAAAAAASAVRSSLFGIAPFDPISFCAISVLLLLTATLACYLPARRAARVDPVVALRAE